MAQISGMKLTIGSPVEVWKDEILYKGSVNLPPKGDGSFWVNATQRKDGDSWTAIKLDLIQVHIRDIPEE